MMTDTAADLGVPATEGSPKLRFEHLSMVFPDGTHAIDDVSFTVHAGEFVTVVGPSGCGKSTLLRIASGLTEHTAGVCDVDRNSIGYVFQDATLLPWRTVQRNVELNAELQGVPKNERQRRAAEAIELVNLVGHEEKYPKQLSGGMKMRCSLARSLVLNPEIFLFDEPFGALDEITRERLNDELISLFNHEQFAALFITHSIAEAVFLSTRVLVMSARPGRIIGDYAVPFGAERPQEIRFEPEFAEICGLINDDLKDAHS
jgi:NitT/TauT family transport system ATP-binding protein